MDSERIYKSGYALAVYTTAPNKRVWKYRDEEITLPAGAVPESYHRSLKATIAKIEDVRAAAK